MLIRLNQLDMIDDYGLMLLRHPGVSRSLKRIHLPGSCVGTTALLSEIGNMQCLTEVNLAFCRCLPANCRALQHLLGSAHHLLSLKLNFLEGDLAFEFLPVFTAMKDLDLTDTQLTTDHLAKAVNTMHCLESLEISSTMVTLLGGLRAASSLPNLQYLGLHDLAVSETEEIGLVSDVQSEVFLSLLALRKVTHLDMSSPRFLSGSTLSRESLLSAVLTAPRAVTDIDVSRIASDNILVKELERSPLLPQLTYVGCVTLEKASSIRLKAAAPNLLVGSLYCHPEHAGGVLRSEYLKRPLLLSCLLHADLANLSLCNVADDSIWYRAGELALSLLWLYRHDADSFAPAEHLASYFWFKCSQLPQFFSLARRYAEFVVNCVDRLVGVEENCLKLLNHTMQAVETHAGLSVKVATCLINALKNFGSKEMSCSELSLLQCLERVGFWNTASVRSRIAFDLGGIELLISRLDHWSQTSIDERMATYTELADLVTDILANLTDGIPDSGQHTVRLLSQVNCIQSLLICLDAFSHNEDIVWGVLCVLGNMAESVLGQSALFHQPMVVQAGIRHMGVTSVSDTVALGACHLIAVLLEADVQEWADMLESRDSACHFLTKTLLGLEIYPHQPRFIEYPSIKPLLNMIECQHVAEVRCFGMWMLASMCNCPNKCHYYTCLGENGHAGLQIVCRANIPADMPNVFCDAKGDIIDGFKLWFERQE